MSITGRMSTIINELNINKQPTITTIITIIILNTILCKLSRYDMVL